MKSSTVIIDVDRPDTWTQPRKGLCRTCAANCCTMPVEVKLPDPVHLGLVDDFEAEHGAPKQITCRASGDCLFLNATPRRCTVYDKRSGYDREHP